MTTPCKFVVHLEQPDVDVEIIRNQPCKGHFEFICVVDIVGTHGDWDVTLLEDALGAGLGSKCVGPHGLTAEDRDAQLDRQLDVKVAYFAWDDVGLSVSNQVIDLLNRFRRVAESLRKTHVLMELGVVFRNDQVEAFAGIFNLDQFQYLHVVFIDFRRHRERTDVDNVDVWIFAREDSHDLRVLLLLQLCDRHPLEVAD